MVQQPDVDEFQRRPDAAGDALVRLARFRNSRRVVVGEDYGRRVDLQGLFDDFPGVDAGAVDRAAEQLLERQDTMPVIQIKAAEQLMREVPEFRHQKCFGIGRTADGVPDWQGLFVIAPCEFRYGLENAETHAAEAFFAGQVALLRVQQAPQAAETGDQPVREVHGRTGIAAALQHHGQQFSFRKRGGAGFLQLAPRRVFALWVGGWHGRSLSGAVCTEADRIAAVAGSSKRQIRVFWTDCWNSGGPNG